MHLIIKWQEVNHRNLKGTVYPSIKSAVFFSCSAVYTWRYYVSFTAVKMSAFSNKTGFGWLCSY